MSRILHPLSVYFPDLLDSDFELDCKLGPDKNYLEHNCSGRTNPPPSSRLRRTSASMVTTKQSRSAREWPILAVVVFLSPLPEVMITTRGVLPKCCGLQMCWRRLQLRSVGSLRDFLWLRCYGEVLQWY
ncbi:translocase inner membrane subunit 44-1 [Striga asiatica]|uniref:Translocase inner membrane subunit 44-1 n=1 Tax=Striga asiatica TaxID=4170 RepID=A0A5A7QEC9_STRAF|nr:translocase inner membrane subunit 44-1 [Striga asiatica]